MKSHKYVCCSPNALTKDIDGLIKWMSASLLNVTAFRWHYLPEWGLLLCSLAELVTRFPRIKEEMKMIRIVSRQPWRWSSWGVTWLLINQLRSLCPWVITYYIHINTFYVPFTSFYITSLPSLKDVTFHSNFHWP